MKNPLAGSPRFPVQGSSGQGESVPKVQPKGVADGNQVNIPEPVFMSSAGTEKGRSAGHWIPVQARRRSVQEQNARTTPRGDDEPLGAK